MKEKHTQSWVLIGLLLFIAACHMVMDIVNLTQGRVDLDRHLPFFYPIVLCIFAGMVWYLDRLTAKRVPELVPSKAPPPGDDV